MTHLQLTSSGRSGVLIQLLDWWYSSTPIYVVKLILMTLIRRVVDRNEMDSHIDNMQADLDNLKELLRGEGISLDANALLGVSARQF